ncbi:unnamed protein product, partial [Amoebophrya sp. A120]|eukprot:GSA120T00010696001.1
MLITDAEDGAEFEDGLDQKFETLFPVEWGIKLSTYIIWRPTAQNENKIASWRFFKRLAETHGGQPVLLDYMGDDAATSDMAATVQGYWKNEERKLMLQEKRAQNPIKWVRFRDPFTGLQRLSACLKLFSTGPYAETEAEFRQLRHYATFCLD